MLNLAGYQTTDQLYAGSRTLVYRAIRVGDRQPVIIKVLRNPHPDFNELVHFRHQYAIAHHLDHPNILQPLALERYGNGYALIMPDRGAIALKDYWQQGNNSLSEFLNIAIQLADALHYLNQQRIIHKDIKPANILICPQTHQVQLIDFSISTLLPKEQQQQINPNVLEGTLAYISPEQTGRMNRGVDYRSDFYSLGITFYELLTGKLPFQTDDAMELVHCHIAKMPEALSKSGEIPEVLSHMVIKLMAKNSEDRYQSSLGLKHDLEHCLHQWERTGKIDRFSLGQRDQCDRFIITEKLYGRETEVNTLLDAFNRIAFPPYSKSEFLLVAGFSGIGKTAVINEVHKPIVEKRGYFIKGKFDQFNRQIPFSGFVQAFRDLIGQLLSESDSELATWKTNLLAALGNNGQVLIDVIPELERIIGEQPAVSELSGSAAEHRFNQLLTKFLAIFTSPEHPLTIFLDDLQWADSASLKLIELLMGDRNIGYLLLLGAYRDNEVFPTHPLMLTLEKLGKETTAISTITLEPLQKHHIHQLVADTLNCGDDLAQPLAKLVYQKTKGNPFFTNQFLQGLYEDHFITFNPSDRYWSYDLIGIQDAAITDDVVHFMEGRLRKLSDETQKALKFAACVGNQFDLATLALICKQSAEETAEDIWEALREGLILPISDAYKFFHTNLKELMVESTVNYRFLHDRVQQAAYALIPETQKAQVHLAIGRLLKQQSSGNADDKNLFTIANNLNLGFDLITDPVEKQTVSQLNFRAARKAKGSTAYTVAETYAGISIQQMGKQILQDNYLPAMAVYEFAAECAYLNGNYQQMEERIEQILDRADGVLDQMKAYDIKIQALTSQRAFAEAIDVVLLSLSLLGIDLPKTPSPEDIQGKSAEIRALVGERSPLSFIELPAMEQPAELATMTILTSGISPTYLAAPSLLLMIVFELIKRSVTFGNAESSPFAYSMYGLILCGILKDVEAGYQFGELALNLLQQFKNPQIQARTMFIVAGHITVWGAHIRESLETLEDAAQIATDNGDLEYVGYITADYCAYWFISGENLLSLEESLPKKIEILQRCNQTNLVGNLETYLQVVLDLMHLIDSSQTILSGTVFNAQEKLPKLKEENHRQGLFILYSNQLLLNYLFEDDQAIASAEAAAEYLDGVTGMALIPWFYFYDSLARLATIGDLTSSGWTAIEARVAENQEKMAYWSSYAPMNFQHKYDLVAAEKCRVLGHRAEAIELYDRAIAGAKDNGYLQEEALANELAAKFYLDWGFGSAQGNGKEKIAATYMQDAYYGYSRWGAKAKVDRLKAKYPELLRPILQPVKQGFNPLKMMTSTSASSSTVFATSTGSHSSESSTNVTLDLIAGLKASQAISSAMDLQELLKQLTQILLQTSGGDRCSIIMPDDLGNWQVQAIATPDTLELSSEPLMGNLNLPVKFIQYIKHTQEVVFINDLQTSLPILDNYLQQHKPKSILCCPIFNQGHLIGILYLENRLTSGAFTEERIYLINVLCTQAGISLENAHLYQLEQEVARALELSEYRFRQLFEKATDAIFLLDDTGVIDCNQATLDLFCYPRKEDFCSIHPAQMSPEFQPDGQTSFEKANATMEVALESGSHRFEWVHKRLDGETFWAEVALTAIPYFGKKILHCLLRDISDRKAAEAAVIQKSEDLEQALQNLQQAQLQLVQSEKMSALGNLMAGVAHEINNPVGFLKGNIQPAQEYIQDLFGLLDLYQEKLPEDPEIEEEIEAIDLEFLQSDLPKLLESMHEGVDRIKNISTSLRTFARKDQEHKTKFNLHEGIESTLLILKHRSKASDHRPAIQFIKEYQELPDVECFPGQLNQVFMNILANAIDAFDEANAGKSYQEIEADPNCITIQTSVLNQNQVEIKIQDNGCGMKPETQERIFEQGFTTKEVGKGTGLGMAIAHQIIVEKHSGTITCTSELGKGTEFAIALPI